MCKFSSIACVVSLLAGVGVASATSINVAILSAMGNTSYETDVVAKITNNAPNGVFLNITVINVGNGVGGSTPSMTTLNGYDTLMVVGGNNPFLDAVTLGNNLKTYIDAGHGVVVSALSNQNSGNCSTPSTYWHLCGGFNDSNYWAMGLGTVTSGAVKTLGTVNLPGDPIMANVGSFNGGSLSTRATGALNAAAIDVADWSDGQPLIATRKFGAATEVALNFFPVSADGYAAYWLPGTDGGKIMANALVVASGLSGAADGAIPEPATYLLTATGFGLLALMLRRRRRTLQCESEQRPRHL